MSEEAWHGLAKRSNTNLVLICCAHNLKRIEIRT